MSAYFFDIVEALHPTACESVQLISVIKAPGVVHPGPIVWPVLSGLSSGNFSLSATLIFIVSFLPKSHI